MAEVKLITNEAILTYELPRGMTGTTKWVQVQCKEVAGSDMPC